MDFSEIMPMPRLWYKGARRTYNDYSQRVLLADPQEVTRVSINWSTRSIIFCVTKRPDACRYHSKKSREAKKPQTEVLMVGFEKFDEDLELIK